MMKTKSTLALALCLTVAIQTGAQSQQPAATPPPLAQPPIPAPTYDQKFSPFGIGACSARSRQYAYSTFIPQMADIGVHEVRSMNGGGFNGKDEPKWDVMDWQYNYLTSEGFRVGGIFYNYRPKPQNGLPMDAMPDFTARVTELVTHFKGKIKHWESWNEPPNGTRKDQTPQDYGQYISGVYDALKAADPNAELGMAAKSADINYLDQAIQAGAKDKFDYITLHPYETLGCTMNVPGAEGLFMNIVPATRKMLAAQDPAKVNCPIVFTEIGFNSKKSVDQQAIALVKTYTMGIAQGVACIQWFEGMDGDSGPMGLMQGNGAKRPAYTALGQLVKALGQYPDYLGWVLLNGKDYGFVFKGDKGPVLVTWGEMGTTDNVDFGQQVSIIDPLTAASTQASTTTLGEKPVIVQPAPDAIVTQAQGNKAKPFPWGGDYSQAKSVSVTYAKTNVEKGLHTFSGAAIAADVLLYGGNARSGSVPGGTVFMVDPNFLTYTSVPLEIDVVARLDEKNDPAKLTLEYESTTGYKKLEPSDIPDNTDWHTIKWQINDDQFVGMWGFNFRFNAGKYIIQSVTVTKLDH
jgi:hypothetical protein